MPAAAAGMCNFRSSNRVISATAGDRRMADTVQRWAGVQSPPLAARGGVGRFMRQRSTVAFLMCLPLLVIITCLVVYPAFYSIWLSMLNKAQTRFIGLGNYRFLLTRDVF